MTARPRWRERLHEVIFEADTTAGRVFDVALLVAIALSVTAVLLESVAAIRAQHGHTLRIVEWALTIGFTVEYVLRLAAVDRPWRYAVSLYGIVDLLAVMPTYLALLMPVTQPFMVIRGIRLLRVFRVLKAAQFLREAELLITALRASTVGYGDIAPRTPLGQLLAAVLMILGYSIIAVPTGIVSAELMQVARPVSRQACPACGAEGHDVDAAHCKYCGARL
jgi:voltage-gated potassium channel